MNENPSDEYLVNNSDQVNSQIKNDVPSEEQRPKWRKKLMWRSEFHVRTRDLVKKQTISRSEEKDGRPLSQRRFTIMMPNIFDCLPSHSYIAA